MVFDDDFVGCCCCCSFGVGIRVVGRWNLARREMKIGRKEIGSGVQSKRRRRRKKKMVVLLGDQDHDRRW